MALGGGTTKRGSAWLIAATAVVCVAGIVALWLMRTGGTAPAGSEAVLPEAPPDSKGRVATAPKWVTPAADGAAGEPRDPDAPVASADGERGVPAPGLLGVILVEAERGADKASVTITEDTALLIERGGQTVAATPGDLVRGTGVRVWYDGPVAESYPVQAVAGTVLIVSAAR